MTLLDKYFEETPSHEVDALIAEIDSLKVEGPTMDEYLNHMVIVSTLTPAEQEALYMKCTKKQLVGFLLERDRVAAIKDERKWVSLHDEVHTSDNCLHDNCPRCGGKGSSSTGLCIHNLACSCPKCAPR